MLHVTFLEFVWSWSTSIALKESAVADALLTSVRCPEQPPRNLYRASPPPKKCVVLFLILQTANLTPSYWKNLYFGRTHYRRWQNSKIKLHENIHRNLSLYIVRKTCRRSEGKEIQREKKKRRGERQGCMWARGTAFNTKTRTHLKA